VLGRGRRLNRADKPDRSHAQCSSETRKGDAAERLPPRRARQSSAALAALSSTRGTRRLAERIGPPERSPPAAETGAAVIQIDGLSHEVLVRALKLRFVPFLRRLLRRSGYAMRRLRVGLPATTPAFHAKVFYGTGDGVPGFAWFDRSARRLRTMKNPADAREVEAALACAPGALEGGSSYGTFFRGGARHSAFTVSATELGSLATTLPAWEVFIFLVANAPALARIVLSAVWELVLELWDHLRAVLAGRPRRSELGFLVERIVANAVMREVTTAAACLDIHRGLPVVWANFPGYDAMAHHRGPRSFRAFWTLRGIDRSIKAIARAIAASRARRYDLYVLSDHGQVRATPFSLVHGTDLRDWLIRRSLPPGGAAGPSPAGRGPGTWGEAELTRAAALPVAQLLSLVRHLRDALPWPLGGLAATLERRLERRLRRRRLPQTLLEAAEAYVLATGDIAHIYLSARERPLELDQIEAAHPGLVDSLLALDGVRAVAARSRGGVLVKGPDGQLFAEARSDGMRLAGRSPLSHVPEEIAILIEVKRLLSMRDSGDLVVFGGGLAGRTHRKSYLNFLDQFGAHGGFEPAEQYAFLMGPPARAAEIARANAPEDLYLLLRSYARGRQLGQTPRAAEPAPSPPPETGS